eukprot:TRINITY_DN12356_c0_g1_i1.p1 TRINITY_DN12356_c0_g1~~TRINITY_DN12356_c0_g1_i1.p1  ORF type:complete len:867 (+),score=136.33 TRINITY_DN12356_c0_g1_i1:254-2854(+)
MAEFKKRTRRGATRKRTKLRLPELEEAADDVVMGESKASTATLSSLSTPKSKPLRSAPLTFDDDDEGDGPAFQVKRSRKSKKLTKKRRTLVNPDAPPQEGSAQLTHGYMHSNASDTADYYSRDSIQSQLRQQGQVTVRLKSTHGKEHLPEGDGSAMVIASEFAGASRTQETTAGMDDAMDVDEEVFGEDENVVGHGGGGSSHLIPTSERIRELKQKRSRRAQLGYSGADYISLSKKMVPVDRQNAPEAGDEGDQDSGDEDAYDPYGHSGNRIGFGDPGKVSKEARQKTLWEIEERMAESEDADEDGLWEEEQMRKTGRTVTKRMAPAGIKGALADYDQKVGATRTQRADREELDPKKAWERTLAYQPPAALITQRNIEVMLGRVTEMYNHHTTEAATAFMAVEDSERKVAEQREEHDSLTQHVTFFQELKEFGLDLLDCLNEKNKTLDTLETSLNEKAIDAATALYAHRRQDATDSLADTRALLAHRSLPSSAEEVQRRAVRDAKYRRLASASEGSGDPVGWMSDDEEEEVYFQEYTGFQKTIAGGAAALFSDVHEEYESLGPILVRFENWKWRYPQEYEHAYGSLSLPKISEVYATQELLARWDLLSMSATQYRDMDWYAALYDYGLNKPKDAAEVPPSLRGKPDRDLDIIPALVASLLYPRLKRILSHLYTPYSQRQTVALSELVRELDGFDGIDKVAQLRKESLIMLRLSLESAAMEHIVLTPKNMTRQPRVVEFYERQFWSGVKLFRNVISWAPALTAEELAPIAFDILFNAKLLPYLHSLDISRAVHAFTIITESIPSNFINFFPPGHIPTFLQALHAEAVRIIATLERKSDFANLRVVVPQLKRLNDSKLARDTTSRLRL